MKTGYMIMMANLHDGLSDADMIREEMRIAELAEDIGYDSIWCAEHHFETYSMAVDNLQVLTWLAARTKNIQLGSAALILPWWTQPIRLVEKISLIDAMSNGRFLVGLGRGLSRNEFESFGVPMSESRSRFDESAKMIIEALASGYIEGSGPHFPQKRTEIHPRPQQNAKDRLYAVAMSPDSAQIVGDLGARMMCFVQFSMDKHLPNFEIYRKAFANTHHRAAPPPLLLDFCYCDKDPAKAEAMVRKHLAANYLSILQHYEFMVDYHKEIKGYEAYGDAATFLNSLGLDAAVDDYIAHQAWGTPQQILDKLAARRDIVGHYEWNSIVSYGGLPFEAVEKSMRLIGKEVLPELKTWQAAPARATVAA
jgi:alkanesulfonate monooxygenase SsuD/methylene tetrahydromethanopterin reductase-like flavin-dependent oxidoreductase (luciferase family)